MNCRIVIKLLPLTFIVLFFLKCAGGTITDYKPSSPQEEGIRTALIALETAWNNHNEQAVLAILDDDFILWVWAEGSRRIVFRKGTFGFNLRDILIRWRYVSLGSPAIWVNNGEATAYVAMLLDGGSNRSTFRLVSRNGKWLILEWEL